MSNCTNVLDFCVCVCSYMFSGLAYVKYVRGDDLIILDILLTAGLVLTRQISATNAGNDSVNPPPGDEDLDLHTKKTTGTFPASANAWTESNLFFCKLKLLLLKLFLDLETDWPKLLSCFIYVDL